jgi:hypothetical protein
MASIPKEFIGVVRCETPESIYYAIDNNYDLSILNLGTAPIWLHPEAIEAYVIAGGKLTLDHFACMVSYSGDHFQRLCQLFPPNLFDNFHNNVSNVVRNALNVSMFCFCGAIDLMITSTRDYETKLEMLDQMISYFPNAKRSLAGSASILNALKMRSTKNALQLLVNLCERKILNVNMVIQFAISAYYWRGDDTRFIFSKNAVLSAAKQLICDVDTLNSDTLFIALQHEHDELVNYLFDLGLRIEIMSDANIFTICRINCSIDILDRLLNAGLDFGAHIHSIILNYHYPSYPANTDAFNAKLKWFIDNIPNVNVIELWKPELLLRCYLLNDQLLGIFGFKKN